MNTNDILTIVTIIITWFLGFFAKKCDFINNNLIPLQNIAIGLLVAIIEWIITKDFSLAIAVSGVIAGGTYDVVHNLGKIVHKED